MFGETADRIETAAGSIEPFASIAHVRLDVGRGQESGAAAALQLEADSLRTSYATAGTRCDLDLAVESARLAVRASAGWQHVFGDTRSEERRVGKECVSTCRSGWSPYIYKKKKSTDRRKRV